MSFTYTTSDNHAILTGATGPINNGVVESYYLGLPVTEVAPQAFMNNLELSGSLDLNNVTIINFQAFQMCTNLNGTITCNSVTDIGINAFSGCTNLTGNLNLPNIITIQEGAFNGCSGLGLFTFSSSLTTIGPLAFQSCTNLTSGPTLDLSNLTILGSSAFSICTSLEGILILPSSLTTISQTTFQQCSKLKSGPTLDLRNVTTLGAGAFRLCSSMAGTLLLSPNLTTIPDTAFQGCIKLKSGPTLDLSNVTTLGSYAFNECSSMIGTLLLSPGLTKINDSTFEACSLLQGLTLSSSNLTHIYQNAFAQSGIHNYDFIECPKLSYIDTSAFNNYENVNVFVNLTTYNLLSPGFPDNVKFIAANSHYTYTTSNGKITITGPLSNLSQIDIPSTISGLPVTTIASNSFYQSPYIIEEPLTIPSSVTTIGSSAFRNSKIKGQLIIPNSVNDIGDYAFSGCDFSGTLTLPSALENIGEHVFSYNQFASLTPPVSLKTIGMYAFYESSLYTYDFTYCDQLTTIHPTAFNNINNSTKIYVYVSQFTYNNIRGLTFPSYVYIMTGIPLSNICFIADTLVETEQGTLPIQTLTRKNTIKGQSIQLTKTMHRDPYLVKIESYAFGDIPTEDTYMSMKHCIYINEQRIEAYKLVNDETVTLVPYNGEPLYNVLVNRHTNMRVHGMLVETLNPESDIALLYNSRLSSLEKNTIAHKLTRKEYDYDALIGYLRRVQ